MNNSTLGARIKRAREEKGLYQGELAKLINVKSAGVISNWEKDINKPDAEKIVALCRALDTSASYLLNYYGESIQELSNKDKNLVCKYHELDKFGQELIDYVIDKELERIRQYNLLKENSINGNHSMSKTRSIIHIENLVSAGTGKFIIDDMPPNLIEIPDILDYKNASYAITVSGDSMEPDFYDGDIVLVEKRSDVDYGDIGIFVIDNEGFIKKCSPDGLVSLNSKYDIIKPIDKVYCMGKVIGKL